MDEKIMYLKSVKFSFRTNVWDWENAGVNPATEIIGWRDGYWEHDNIHNGIINPDTYYNSIPPVEAESYKGFLFFQDGFHRANFCRKNGLLLPVKIK